MGDGYGASGYGGYGYSSYGSYGYDSYGASGYGYTNYTSVSDNSAVGLSDYVYSNYDIAGYYSGYGCKRTHYSSTPGISILECDNYDLGNLDETKVKPNSYTGFGCKDY